jgi:hypothetical protein
LGARGCRGDKEKRANREDKEKSVEREREREREGVLRRRETSHGELKSKAQERTARRGEDHVGLLGGSGELGDPAVVAHEGTAQRHGLGHGCDKNKRGWWVSEEVKNP